MMKEVLMFFSVGLCDSEEIGRRLKKKPAEVETTIQELEQKGFIKKEGCDPNAPKCAGCPMAQLAAELGAYYTLTKEGWEYLKKEE